MNNSGFRKIYLLPLKSSFNISVFGREPKPQTLLPPFLFLKINSSNRKRE
jgi:hypothetical protein